MQSLANISDRQRIVFGNTENSCLCHFQNTEYQYKYDCKITPNSTGKELDQETGYSYFGARYLDHELLISWLSVDPMADKYPSISPYAYCAWNPMKLVDPDGRDLEDPPTKFKNIEPVIDKSDFIGWGHPGVKRNCFDYAKKQMNNAGYDVGGGKDPTNIYPYNEKTGSNDAAFKKAVEYIPSCLEEGIPLRRMFQSRIVARCGGCSSCVLLRQICNLTQNIIRISKSTKTQYNSPSNVISTKSVFCNH